MDDNTTGERRVSVYDGKYTFILHAGDYRVHVIRHGEQWLVIEQGCNAIRSLVWEHADAMALVNAVRRWATAGDGHLQHSELHQAFRAYCDERGEKKPAKLEESNGWRTDAAGAETARLRARWAASLPFVEAVVSLWNETFSDEGAPIRHKFDRRWVRAMLDAAIGALGQLALTLTDVELADLPEGVTPAPRGGVDVDASLAKTREWTMATAEMEKAEADLDAIDKRGSILVAELLRMRRENPDAYPREGSEPDISDEEIEVRHAAACTTGDERTRMLCEIAHSDGETMRRIARAALATRNKP